MKMDEDILPTKQEFSYSDNPSEEINVVFRRKALEFGININELAFGDYKKN